ncbi:hypothetical protein DL89DRAFT_294565 [Linderina pennispora]|uniref:Arrestin-like N-terminal domain-containing protein n=1 Tax=Linderina pennispora TaxID=61395 RepID=A0A1Y1W3C9_9FUNG|nr:uncharacterized protein DL89DRAFT_294565 [Linderina pennispora]ORX68053.1 hypothetical protein DL89DRAFT_294565 [Linderina pennispora]
MPFSGPASDLTIDLGPGSYDDTTALTRHHGRVLLTLTKPMAVHSVQLLLLGEETVNLRAWIPLSTNTASTPIVDIQRDLYSGGTLEPGMHVFPFTLVLPGTLPTTLERELCTIKYRVRAEVAKAAFFSSPSIALAKEEEVLVVHRRRAKRLAKTKSLDQSFAGSISKDVVRPGSKSQFGLRLLAVNFAEAVQCHVQVRGEERLTTQITNLVGSRLDALEGDPVIAAGAENDDMRTVRKTRSRLTDLLKASTPPPTPPQMPGSVANGSTTGLALGGRGSAGTPRVVRQIRATHTLEVPQGLSQFDAEYISREYRLMLVAEVAPMEDTPENADSVHINEARLDISPRSTFDSTRKSSSSMDHRSTIVDTFSVVDASKSTADIIVGQYRMLGSDDPANATLGSTLHQQMSLPPPQHVHHRRTSSGLVGFLKRGFRSSSPRPESEPSGSSRSVTPVNGDASYSEHIQQLPGIRAAVAATRSMRSSSAPHHPPPSAIFGQPNGSSKE